MRKYHVIEFDSYYLTDNSASNGNPYITEISGLGALSTTLQSNALVAIDGTIHEQFNDNKGLPISIKFPLIDSTLYGNMMDSIDDARNSNTSISLSITGPAGSFSLSVRSVGVDLSGNAIEAGLQDVTFNFLTT